MFFLTLLLTFKYSGFIVLKDTLCKGIFQKAEGLTVLNMCSGVSGALLKNELHKDAFQTGIIEMFSVMDLWPGTSGSSFAQA